MNGFQFAAMFLLLYVSLLLYIKDLGFGDWKVLTHALFIYLILLTVSLFGDVTAFSFNNA